MTNPSVLLELAGRVEALTEASLGVDAAIWQGLGNCVHEMALGRVEVEPGEYDVVSRCVHCGDYKGFAPPRLTASIDAAMSLRPKGWTIANIGEGDDGTWFVEMREGYRTSYNRVAMSHTHCATPALALTAACLRALAAREG